MVDVCLEKATDARTERYNEDSIETQLVCARTRMRHQCVCDCAFIHAPLVISPSPFKNRGKDKENVCMRLCAYSPLVSFFAIQSMPSGVSSPEIPTSTHRPCPEVSPPQVTTLPNASMRSLLACTTLHQRARTRT